MRCPQVNRHESVPFSLLRLRLQVGQRCCRAGVGSVPGSRLSLLHGSFHLILVAASMRASPIIFPIFQGSGSGS